MNLNCNIFFEGEEILGNIAEYPTNQDLKTKPSLNESY